MVMDGRSVGEGTEAEREKSKGMNPKSRGNPNESIEKNTISLPENVLPDGFLHLPNYQRDKICKKYTAKK